MIIYFVYSIILIVSKGHALPQLQNEQQQQQLQYNNNDNKNNQRQYDSISGTSPIPIISQTEITGGDGSFNYSFETGNGIKMEEVSYVKKNPTFQGRSGQLTDEEGGDGNVQVKSGSYSYTAPDGTVINLKYIADENGFQPEGDHLPTTPPTPDYVKRLLSELPQNNSENTRQYQNNPVASQVAFQEEQTLDNDENYPVNENEPV